MVFLAIIFTLSLANLVNAQTAKPNIVFIITDDQRADTLDYMPKTMQLLAAQGILFNNSFASFLLLALQILKKKSILMLT